MSLKINNTLTGLKEEFKSIEKGKVKMYACGITVSGDAHIGHAYQAVIFDMIRKYLEYSGYSVTYVRNYTDVDDKIIINARKKGVDPLEYAQHYIDKTNKELKLLGVEEPTIQARATECIPDMIEFISKLIGKGHAYATDDGNVYFDVTSFKNYGEFSNKKLDELLSGVRKELEPGKKDERDFALWKKAGNDEIYWDSPWGKGRPGWHIECSTMSMKFLGETLDIHGGGRDLKFPHHENEIAQSEALTGKRFSNYWIHNGLVKINGQKMSKSLGNGILLEDLLKEYDSDVIKMTLLRNKYSSDLNVVPGMFEETERKVYHIYKLFNYVNENGNEFKINKESLLYKEIINNFIKAMDDDFNASIVLSELISKLSAFENMMRNKKEMQSLVDAVGAIKDTYTVLGLFTKQPSLVIENIKNKYLSKNSITEEQIIDLIEKRKKLKKEGNYLESDKIREKLQEKGIEIRDTREKTLWDIL